MLQSGDGLRALTGRRVAVVGAGPGGLASALLLARAGIHVTLFEKADGPGGTWRDWPRKLVADCHKSKTGKTYPSVYGRMEWDKPSPTITTQFFGFGNGRFGHPEQHRAISLREGAILQSFPKRYQFVEKGGDYCFKAIGRLIGFGHI